MCDAVSGAESSHEPLDTGGSLILHQPCRLHWGSVFQFVVYLDIL